MDGILTSTAQFCEDKPLGVLLTFEFLNERLFVSRGWYDIIGRHDAFRSQL